MSDYMRTVTEPTQNVGCVYACYTHTGVCTRDCPLLLLHPPATQCIIMYASEHPYIDLASLHKTPSCEDCVPNEVFDACGFVLHISGQLPHYCRIELFTIYEFPLNIQLARCCAIK